MFDEHRYFLPKNHNYRTIEEKKFNGKEENAKKPRRMTPHLWKLEYNRNRRGMQIVYVAYNITSRNIMIFIFLLNCLYHGCHE